MKESRKTKIIATVGPACNSEEQIEELIKAGANVFRLNFSHETHEVQLARLKMIRKVSKRLNKAVGVLQDLQGPKIRVGVVQEGGIMLEEGAPFIITTEEMLGEGNKVSTTYKSLSSDVKPGDRILLDDGLLELEVVESKGSEVHCSVKTGGKLTSKKGINLPNVALSTPAMTEKDKEDVEFAIEHDVDFIALSFVRAPEDIKELKDMLKTAGKDIPVIAKIEKPEALTHIDEIINESYGIMVARGDLGVEVEAESVPAHQKEIIKKCNRLGKPVIVATQVLDSMIRNPRPTRAEASDVANAVLDGTDAVMLSGETAAGKYPIQSVLMMAKIIKSTEARFLKDMPIPCEDNHEVISVAQGVCKAAIDLGGALKAKAVVCVTVAGETPRDFTRFRSSLPVFAITDNERVMNRMALFWGIRATMIERIERTELCFQEIEKLLDDTGLFEDDDIVILIAGVPISADSTTNTIKVHRIHQQVDSLF